MLKFDGNLFKDIVRKNASGVCKGFKVKIEGCIKTRLKAIEALKLLLAQKKALKAIEVLTAK